MLFDFTKANQKMSICSLWTGQSNGMYHSLLFRICKFCVANDMNISAICKLFTLCGQKKTATSVNNEDFRIDFSEIRDKPGECSILDLFYRKNHE